MVIKRRFKTRRFRRNGRRAYKKIARITRRTIHRMAETKFKFSTKITVTPFLQALTTITWSLDNLSQNVGTEGRIGNQIQCRSFSAHFRAYFDGNGARDDATLTMYVIFPRKTQSGNGPVLGQIPNNLSWPDPENWICWKQKFLTFGDHDAAEYGGGLPSVRMWKFHKKVPLVCHYNGTSVDREPYIVLFSDVDNTTAARLNVEYITRVSYKDY